jgi:hypothetical protein
VGVKTETFEKKIGRYLIKNIPIIVPDWIVVDLICYMKKYQIVTLDYNQWKEGNDNV